jgi:hypothetical protein
MIIVSPYVSVRLLHGTLNLATKSWCVRRVHAPVHQFFKEAPTARFLQSCTMASLSERHSSNEQKGHLRGDSDLDQIKRKQRHEGMLFLPVSDLIQWNSKSLAPYDGQLERASIQKMHSPRLVTIGKPQRVSEQSSMHAIYTEVLH